MWSIEGQSLPGQLGHNQLSLIERHQFPASWREKNSFYQLRWHPALEELSERVIVDWGRSPRRWIQVAGEANDKPVLEIKQREAIGAFTSYADVRLSFTELRRLVDNPDANMGWKHALSAVHGVYLIREITTGLLYVGSAYGAGGIYGRWESYAVDGHGGNVMMHGRDPTHFEFSILQVISPATPRAVIIDIENQWKTRLGTRENGHLNSAEATGR